MSRVKKLLVAVSVVFLLAGCATSSLFLDRDLSARETAGKNGFTKNIIQGHDFVLLSYVRIGETGKPLVIYIEGDGVAWESRSRVSSDPTPADPLVIGLAALDPSPNVAYLARPGQYTSLGAYPCDAKYWTARRFSQEVIENMDFAVGRLRDMADAPSVALIGYSGGGAVAALVAARRDDVVSLRTIAGNIDHEAVSKWNNVSPLNGSLNPIDYADKLKGLPQRHFIAADDKVVPSCATESFVDNIGDEKHESITLVRGVTHYSGWQAKWRDLLDIPLY
jgi:pimeloyl-ACP methyl ester carboxylesterase